MLRHCNILFLTIAIAFASCSRGTDDRTCVLGTLTAVADEEKYMFGHQDDLNYGHSWYLEDGRSDVRDVCGDYPAVAGFDLGGIELGDSLSIDSVPFDYLRKVASDHIARGGIVTFSWHACNPLTGGSAWDVSDDGTVASILPGGEKHADFLVWLDRVADFLSSINGGDGMIFRPWHENVGSWFWWGAGLCTEEQYRSLWEMTYDHLTRERGLNMIWAYSPNAGINREEYMSRYPGDDVVDLFGLDAYQAYEYGDATAFTGLLADNLGYIREIAREKNKPFALTETGCEGLPDAQWWTGVLAKALDDSGISYVLCWRNACDRAEHFFVPYKGSASENDFIEFYNSDKTLFLNDIQK